MFLFVFEKNFVLYNPFNFFDREQFYNKTYQNNAKDGNDTVGFPIQMQARNSIGGNYGEYGKQKQLQQVYPRNALFKKVFYNQYFCNKKKYLCAKACNGGSGRFEMGNEEKI